MTVFRIRLVYTVSLSYCLRESRLRSQMGRGTVPNWATLVFLLLALALGLDRFSGEYYAPFKVGLFGPAVSAGVALGFLSPHARCAVAWPFVVVGTTVFVEIEAATFRFELSRDLPLMDDERLLYAAEPRLEALDTWSVSLARSLSSSAARRDS